MGQLQTNKPTKAEKVSSFLPSHCGVEGNHHFLMISSSVRVLLASNNPSFWHISQGLIDKSEMYTKIMKILAIKIS